MAIAPDSVVSLSLKTLADSDTNLTRQRGNLKGRRSNASSWPEIVSFQAESIGDRLDWRHFSILRLAQTDRSLIEVGSGWICVKAGNLNEGMQILRGLINLPRND